MHPNAPKPLVEIYDTTLRDGSQREGISYTLDDKLRIAHKLDEFGVAFIEGGWPGSNPKDAEFFARARDLDWKHAVVTAFGSTRRAKLGPENDPSLRALLDAGTPRARIFGKSSTLHVTDVLRTTLDENLEMIEESVALPREPRSGASSTTPSTSSTAIARRRRTRSKRCARRCAAAPKPSCSATPTAAACPGTSRRSSRAVVAALGPNRASASTPTTTRAAASRTRSPRVRAGAAPRAGHDQRLRRALRKREPHASSSRTSSSSSTCAASCRGGSPSSAELSRFVAEVANLAPDDHMAYVGKSAFAHKGGVHVAAMRRARRLVPAHRSGAGRQRDARRRERALGSRQRALQGRRARRARLGGRASSRRSRRSSKPRRAASRSRAPRPRSRSCSAARRPTTSRSSRCSTTSPGRPARRRRYLRRSRP